MRPDWENMIRFVDAVSVVTSARVMAEIIVALRKKLRNSTTKATTLTY